MNPSVNNDYISINDLSDMTVGGQTLCQSFVSTMTEIRLINAVIETSNSTSASSTDPSTNTLPISANFTYSEISLHRCLDEVSCR
jgi:hypothetical protein